eukprot:SAG31_NODE_567_length_14028_cov_4.022328_9_plen_83_part_00
MFGQHSVDAQQARRDRHKRFGAVGPFYVTVQSGEMLYIPAFWWHGVISLPPKRNNASVVSDEVCVSLAYWSEPFADKFRKDP